MSGGFHGADSQAGVVLPPKVQAHNPHHTQVHFMQQAQRPWGIRMAEQPAVQRYSSAMCRKRVHVMCVDSIPGGEAGAMGVVMLAASHERAAISPTAGHLYQTGNDSDKGQPG